MKVNKQFALEAYSHVGAVRDYSRAVGQVGLWNCERSIFRQHLPADGRILDLGCGAGRTTFGLHDEGYRNLIGVDFSPGLIRRPGSTRSGGANGSRSGWGMPATFHSGPAPSRAFSSPSTA